MQNMDNFLRSFNENQLRQINDFLSTPKGRMLKNKINSSDKEKLMREFSKIDEREIKKKIKGFSREDILKIINNL